MMVQCYAKMYMGFKVQKFVKSHIEIAIALQEAKGVNIFVTAVKKDLDHSFSLQKAMLPLLGNELKAK
jgi:hypothetical protein